MGDADRLCDQFVIQTSFIFFHLQSIDLKQAIVHLLSSANPNHVATVMHKIEAENAELNIMEFSRPPHYAP